MSILRGKEELMTEDERIEWETLVKAFDSIDIMNVGKDLKKITTKKATRPEAKPPCKFAHKTKYKGVRNRHLFQSVLSKRIWRKIANKSQVTTCALIPK